MQRLTTTFWLFFTRVLVLPGVLLATIFLTSCRDDIGELVENVRERIDDLPDEVAFQAPGIYPEGIEYDLLSNRFLLSSLTTGTIGEVDDAGNYRPFIIDEDLFSSVGIEVDVLRQRLLVANADLGIAANTSDSTSGQTASLGIYDLSSGNRIAMIDLTEADTLARPHFANDVTVDLQGNIYVTDSFSPIIYKVSNDNEVSVFLENDTFLPPPGGFGLNGIVYHPGGFLIVAFSATNSLYRVPLNNPEGFTLIEVEAELNGVDGLYIGIDPRELVVVNNAGGEDSANLTRLFSSNALFRSVVPTGQFNTGAVFPTTVVQRGGQYFVLNSFIGEIFGGSADRSTFSIQRAIF